MLSFTIKALCLSVAATMIIASGVSLAIRFTD